ncbi:MAG: L-aspartate oxidase [Eubacteriales bacterium]
MTKDLTYDVVVVGAGVGGLYTVLNLPRDRNILLICKEDLDTCDSMLAQGGICVLLNDDDYDDYFEDTMRAGHYENRKESVDLMLRSSRAVIDDLLALGVRFEKNPDGSLKYTREGAHSRARICYHEDITGREITTVLQRHVKELENVTIMEYTVMTDLLTENGVCVGIVAKQNGDVLRIHASDTVLATGGIGGLYEHSTNYPCLTGDAIRITQKYGVEMEHLDYVQIHPTSLYTEKPGRKFLISESARGEGAILLNSKGERFVNELLPRDVVSAAIRAELEKEGSKHVWLSFRNVSREDLLTHFPNIRKTCLEEGYDILKEPIPVVPAQHYFMGGIHVDRDSKTTMDHLYAVGETSCNGVHGKNRLASNSLLETLVFAKRAACRIGEYGKARGNAEFTKWISLLQQKVSTQHTI